MPKKLLLDPAITRRPGALEADAPPGAQFREAYFAPTFSKWVGETVGGVQLHIIDARHFDAVRTATLMIVTARQLYPSDFAWRTDNWIDKLTGSTRFRTMVDAGASADEIVAAWQPELADFEKLRHVQLLYGAHGRSRS